MCHRSRSSNCRGGGISAGFPIGAPASTHLAMRSTSSSVGDGSFLNFLMPTDLSIYHGGISRVNVGVGLGGGAWAAPTILAAASTTSMRAGITSFRAEPIGFSFFINNSFIGLDYLSSTYGLRWRYQDILHLERHGDWTFQQ